MKPKLKELLFASFSFDEYDPMHTKALILNAMYFITIIINVIFAIINLLFTHNFPVGILNLFILFATLYAFYLLREKNDQSRSIIIGNFTLFFSFLILIQIHHGNDYSFIWTYFFAPFSMVTLGAKKGFTLSLLFLMLVFISTALGLDNWQDGMWNLASYMRFMLAHIVMLYIMYALINSNEKANEKIRTLREKEISQLKLFEKLSITDPLTSLYNRRSLKEIFPREFHKSRQKGDHIVYFLLDLDYFKSYNDTYGHQKGDDVLVKVSNILRSHASYSFRIGGDEFAGILIGKDETYFKQKLEKIKQALDQMKIENRESPIKPYLSCSIGAHLITESEYDFEEIYQTTDIALYKAKAQGRNQIVYL